MRAPPQPAAKRGQQSRREQQGSQRPAGQERRVHAFHHGRGGMSIRRAATKPPQSPALPATIASRPNIRARLLPASAETISAPSRMADESIWRTETSAQPSSGRVRHATSAPTMQAARKKGRRTAILSIPSSRDGGDGPTPPARRARDKGQGPV